MNKYTMVNILEASNIVYDKLATEHGCGWMDGGCFTFAKAVNEIFPEDTVLFHISRDRYVIDHAVVYFPILNVYLDADGLHTVKELFKKMKEVEFVDVSICTPIINLDDQVIYDDIKELLKENFYKLNNEYLKRKEKK